MKDRNLTALVVVGWYLILGDPPLPKGNWGIFESFDTAAECRQAKDKLIEDAKAKKSEEWVMTYAHGTCLATDDPRIRSK
jgi:hypothetical protein